MLKEAEGFSIGCQLRMCSCSGVAKVDSFPGAAPSNDSEGSHRCLTSRLTQFADFSRKSALWDGFI